MFYLSTLMKRKTLFQCLIIFPPFIAYKFLVEC